MIKNNKGTMAATAIFMAALMMFCGLISAGLSSAEEVSSDECNEFDLSVSNFGGSGEDRFNGVAATSDGGFIAVGYSAAASFDSGDWPDVIGRGGEDAIIVKYDVSGDVVWKKNFGGGSNDRFNGVAATSDGGFIAVGYSAAASFFSGDWTGVAGRGGEDAIIVKYDVSGDVVWKKNFGGSSNDRFNSVLATSNSGFIAVGYSTSFASGDWPDVIGRGGEDAIIVKCDASGDVVWKKNFGGSGEDRFNGVAATSDGGFFAVGYSRGASFGSGDWTDVARRGMTDAIIVKYDVSGDVVWKKNFGGSGSNYFDGVVLASDGGLVAVGDSSKVGDVDLTGLTGYGSIDAIIVKYDASGDVVWKKNFGGNNTDDFSSVAVSGDSFIAACASVGGFNSGDLIGLTGHGGLDAIIVKYDASGDVVWKKNFGGSGDDRFNGISVLPNGSIVAVGNSVAASFGTGDLTGLTGQGGWDAIISVFVSLSGDGDGAGDGDGGKDSDENTNTGGCVKIPLKDRILQLFPLISVILMFFVTVGAIVMARGHKKKGKRIILRALLFDVLMIVVLAVLRMKGAI